ncbi:sporulation protein YabP [Clostridium sporogenes]|uniref:Sporulation protein YabP n=1 Tax=Clostridium botulinum TaxID=1491 RepID=A0A6M0T310_CLOBO|nr:sporulation protein YabP [Clostridium sporogenes]EJP6473069.1 sporulation protein YabP [Clostridium botulinum]NFA61192.1 sporulation protein YabP [Clostridium botulinum]NFI75038.1 sporulation protein YabP [Clostridium sporogenes]NFL71974.1 sporulation protein YabP [Clostridium sporogenes]NFM25244.1 sporulation protein YabP [Clostridium sporogenes]
MEKKEFKNDDKISNLNLENRKKLILSGVNEVISFNEEQIMLKTTLGDLDIKGSNLKMNKLDVQNGDVIIVGTINSCIYLNNESKTKRSNIFSKLFR